MSTANFSNLQVSTNASNNSQVLLRLDNSLSGTAGFARINRLNFEKSFSFYNIFQTSSANWQSTYTTFSSSSAIFESLYNTVRTYSAVQWNYQGNDIKSVSANWQNTYTTFSAQSANNLSVYSTVNTNSATNWRGLTIFTQVSSITNPNSAIPVFGLSAISLPSFNLSGGSTDFALIPAVSGALLAQIPDGTIANGNRRGLYATDWQRYRFEAAANRVASGSFSTICGGRNNAATTNEATVCGGNSNIAQGTAATVGGGSGNNAGAPYSTIIGGADNLIETSADYSIASGFRARSRLAGQISHSSGIFNVTGDAQNVMWILRNKTVGNGISSLYINGTGATRRIVLQQGYLYSLNFKILGCEEDANNIIEYNKRVIVECTTAGSGNMIFVSDVNITPPFNTTASASAYIETVDSGDILDIKVNGIAGNWRWVAVAEGIEMKYPTSTVP
jgi:hypothetical protein